MSCVRNLSIHHALKYFHDDIQKKEVKGFDYYSQEDSGVWFGKTAERLGFIDKKFSEKDYKGVMEGKFSYFDTNTGKAVNVDLTKNSKNKEHHAGIEITLSAPKSVSIMAEIFKDKRVLEAHIMAINSTMNYIQNNFIYTRSSINGKIITEKVDNLMAIKFTHHTNRNQDPQLHTHVLVENIIIDKKGKIKTAEHGMIFENERFIRELYNGELAHNLQILGYDIEWDKKVTQVAPEIKDVPKTLIDMFSSRRQEIEKLAEERGIDLSDQRAMQNLTLETRRTKDNSIGIEELSPVWEEKISELGINIDKFKAELYNKNIENQNKLQSKNNLITKAVNDSIFHLTERNATFTKENLISNIIFRSKGLFGISEIEKAISKNKELVYSKIGMREYAKHLQIYSEKDKIIYTTKSQIETENRIITGINNGKNKFTSIYSKFEIDNFDLKEKTNNNINDLLFADIEKKNTNLYSTLNENQKHTVEFILQNKNQFIGIQGYAGVGKTYTIKALNEKLKAKGYKIMGFAPTNSASAALFEEAGIKTDTLQSFLLKYNGYANDRDGNKLALQGLKKNFKNKIILVDEASLISNKQMKELVTIAEKLEARVIMQGDIKQLGSVEAGSPFELLIKNKIIEYDILKNIQRQKDVELKNAVIDVVNSNIKQAFNRLKKYENDRQNDINYNLYTHKMRGKDKNDISKIIEMRTDKELVDEIKNGKYSMAQLKEEIVEATVNEFLKFESGKKENKNKTIIVTSSNEIRKEINNKLRTHFKESNLKMIEAKKIDKFGLMKDIETYDINKKVIVETLEMKSLTTQERKELNNYDIGNKIIFSKSNSNSGIEKNTTYEVISINEVIKEDNYKNNEIIISDGKKEIKLDITKYSNNFNIYEKIDKELVPNDKIKWTITNKEKGIIKGSDLIVKDITFAENKQNINKTKNATITILDIKHNKEMVLNLNNNDDKTLLSHIDYNYVTTSYSSQGKTSKNVVYTLESYRPNLTTQKDFYVGLSRTKDNVVIITDNTNASIQSLIKNTGEKLTANDLKIETIINHNKDSNISNIANKPTNIELELN